MTRKELFESIGKDLGKLVGKKDEHYGEMMRSTAQYLASVFPNGIKVEQYGIVGLHVRIFDKLRRSTNGTHDNAEDWRDIAGYGLQGLAHYTDIIEQRIIADEQVEAEQRKATWITDSDRPDNIICSHCNSAFSMWTNEAKDTEVCPTCGYEMQVEAEQRETHGERTETYEQLVERAFGNLEKFCLGKTCKRCAFAEAKKEKGITCGDICWQHPQLALGLMESATNN